MSNMIKGLAVSILSFSLAFPANAYEVRKLGLVDKCLMQAQMFEGDLEMARQMPAAWDMVKVGYMNGVGGNCTEDEKKRIFSALKVTSDEQAKFAK